MLREASRITFRTKEVRLMYDDYAPHAQLGAIKLLQGIISAQKPRKSHEKWMKMANMATKHGVLG